MGLDTSTTAGILRNIDFESERTGGYLTFLLFIQNNGDTAGSIRAFLINTWIIRDPNFGDILQRFLAFDFGNARVFRWLTCEFLATGIGGGVGHFGHLMEFFVAFLWLRRAF